MFELLLTIATAIFCSFMGFAIFLRDKGSQTHKSFFGLTTVISLWTVANYFSLHNSTEEGTLFWIRIVMAITAFLGPGLYAFLYNFPNRKRKLSLLQHVLLSISPLFVVAIAFTPLLFKRVEINHGNITPIPGPLFALFILNTFIPIFAGFYTIFRKYRHSKGLIRQQIRYLVLGTATTFTIYTITNLYAVVVLRTSQLVILGPIFTLIMLGLIAYSIVKHRFLDIKLILFRSVIYSMAIFVIALLYGITLFYIANTVLGENIKPAGLMLSIGLSLLITLSFQPLKKWVERRTEGIFYRHTYKPEKLLQELSRIISSNIVLESLLELTLRKIQDNLKTTFIGVVLEEQTHPRFFQPIGSGKDVTREQKTKLHHLFQEIFETHGGKILVFEELFESDLKKRMRELEVYVLFPLVVQDELIGGLYLGEKSSGEIYSSEDITVLEIITPQLAVAIKNALSYEEIRNFSYTLEDEIERATRKLQKANNRLKELDHLKDEFVSVASHELRTPMTAIRSYLWLALHNSPKPLPPAVIKYLDIAYNSTERLIHLVQDMLTISRIEGKRFELQKTKFVLNDLIAQVLEELKVKADEKDLELLFKKSSPKVSVLADKNRMREVFQNLIGNAIKFTPEEGKVSIEVEKNTEYLTVKVSDTGPGISPDEKLKLFHKFSRLDSSYAKTPEAGTGLGLYIAQQIAQLHQATIDVTSEVGVGSTFSLNLPVSMIES